MQNKTIFATTMIFSTVLLTASLAIVLTTHAVDASLVRAKSCAGNPHDAGKSGNPHDAGDKGNPHDAVGAGIKPNPEADTCSGSK